ncbi:hypothetical protein THAOC_35655 [Thalassiosira oceanica]|uniref:Uncharacterized protein n=1 Tax=Thalassiosira oceanica TaxID=159749 RepID=K0R1D8_THAOC|nr:hypothetical protein THAOC_35655 [Thalassiosira oceanica]|eukprot:EJK45715.1 hypothetical protein THAOC_35655 [Thalassiosira oceanica]
MVCGYDDGFLKAAQMLLSWGAEFFLHGKEINRSGPGVWNTVCYRMFSQGCVAIADLVSSELGGRRTPQDPGYYVERKNNKLIRHDFKSNEECQAFIANIGADEEEPAEVDPNECGGQGGPGCAADLLAELGLGDLEEHSSSNASKKGKPPAGKKKKGGKKKGRK